MKLFNIDDEDEKTTFFSEIIEWEMPIFVYNGEANSKLILVSWTAIENPEDVEIFISELDKKKIKEIESDLDEDEPLYDDTDTMEDWLLWM